MSDTTAAVYRILGRSEYSPAQLLSILLRDNDPVKAYRLVESEIDSGELLREIQIQLANRPRRGGSLHPRLTHLYFVVARSAVHPRYRMPLGHS